MPKRIFISHSSKDKGLARRLATDLYTSGHKPWLDETEIKVGEDIVKKIEEGISIADYVIVILSKNSSVSGWVEKEWKTKYWDEIQRKQVLILPILIEECDIPGLLKTKKYADFRESYAVGFAELIQAIGVVEKDISAEGVTPDVHQVVDASELSLDVGTSEQLARELAKLGLSSKSINLSQKLLKLYEREGSHQKAAHWGLHIAVQFRHQGKFIESLQRYAYAEQHILQCLKQEPAKLETRIIYWRIKAGRIMVEDYMLNGNFERATEEYSQLCKDIDEYQADNTDTDLTVSNRMNVYRIHALRQQAEMQRMLGKYANSFELFSKTYDDYHFIYAEEKAYSRLGQAESLRLLGRHEEALEWYREAEWIAREKNKLRLLARVLRSKAELLRLQGSTESLLVLEEMKRLSETEEISYLFGRIYYLLTLGGYYLDEDLDRASSLFEQAQGLAKNGEFCLRVEYAHSLFGLAEAKRLGQDKDKAKDLYGAAHFLYKRMGIRWGQARTAIALTLTSAESKYDLPIELEGTDSELVEMFSKNTLREDKNLFLNIP